MREKCPQKFIQSREKKKRKKEKKVCQTENPKGQSRQKLGLKKEKKKKKKRKPARLKTQKGGLDKSQGQRKEEKKKRKIGKSYQVGNLRMQTKKRRILQDESLEV